MRDIDTLGLSRARTLGDRATQQPIMLDVIDDLEQADRDQALANEVHEPQPPRRIGRLHHHQHADQCKADRREIPANKFAAQQTPCLLMARCLLPARVTLALQFERTQRIAPQGAQYEAVD